MSHGRGFRPGRAMLVFSNGSCAAPASLHLRTKQNRGFGFGISLPPGRQRHGGVRFFSPKTACRRVFRPGDGAASVLLGQGLRGVGAFRLGERAASVLFLAENRAAFCARHAAAVRLRRLSAVVHGRRSGVPPGIERHNGWRDGKGQSRIPLRQILCPGLLYRHKMHNRPLRYCSSATLPFAESCRFVSERPAAIRISPGAPNAQANSSPSAPHCGGKRDVCAPLHRDATAVENLCAAVGRDVRRVAGCARHAVRRASPSLPLVPRRLCGDSTAASVRTLPPVRACKKRGVRAKTRTPLRLSKRLLTLSF